MPRPDAPHAIDGTSRCGTHYVCVGNELVGDDGIGIRIGRVLEALELPREISVELRFNLGFDLLDLIEQRIARGQVGPDVGGREWTAPSLSATSRYSADLGPSLVEERLVVVDAIMSTGSAAGTCRVWSGAELLSRGLGETAGTCCHLVGIGSVLEMAARLWPHVVERSVLVVGIEGANFAEYTTELSPAVRSALPAAVARVLAIAGADAGLLSRAVAECETWMGRAPSVAEVCHPVKRARSLSG